MNRTILFRGKRIDNGEWVEGDYLSCQKSIVFISWTKVVNTIGNSYVYKIYYENIEVIPETVSQFTGLSDCNQKMIFEGDVVMYPDKTIYDGNNEYGFIDYLNGQYIIKYDNYTIIPSWASSKDMKVYGNKWDNPDLLKGGE